MSEEIDAYDLALLAAQLMCRQNSPSSAVGTAWDLIEGAKDKLAGVRLETETKSPEADAEWEKQRAEREANATLDFRRYVMCVTGQDQWSLALPRYKNYKARKLPKGWTLDATMKAYRGKKFTVAETRREKAAYECFVTGYKGGRGRVRDKLSDRRFKKNRHLPPKDRKNKPKLVFTGDIDGIHAATGGIVFQD
jgi:hypothetical protein